MQLYTQPNNSGDNGCTITAAETASTKREAAETEIEFFFSYDKLQRFTKTTFLLRIVVERNFRSKSAEETTNFREIQNLSGKLGI